MNELPIPPAGPAGACDAPRSAPAGELRAAARAAWAIAEPRAKAAAASAIGEAVAAGAAGALRPDPCAAFDDATRPGRPGAPRLVHPRDVPQRGVGSDEGRAALLHAIAHIEFNAIDLALDAVWRFGGLPEAWYLDWAGVAAEEALHFGLLADELRRRGHAYGDFDAHDGLWAMALRTRGDALARVALVPRLMEARGLDVTPQIQARLASAGDEAGRAILQRILDDEVGHVAIGNRWYAWLCAREGVDPLGGGDALASRHGASSPRPP
ncbi:MAG: ferritin-like domain-containing protein, partial [Burkholderiales bacterium]